MNDLPRSPEQVRFDYWWNLQEELDRIQTEFECDSGSDDIDFVCESFNRGRMMFVGANTVRFETKIIDKCILNIISQQPDVWSEPTMYAIISSDGNPHVIVEFYLVDS